MAKINLCKSFVTLKGEVIKDPEGVEVKMNTFLANCIVGRGGKNPMTALSLAQTLFNAKGEVEVNADELKIMEEAAQDEKNTTLVAGQLLKEISGAEK